jgi:hypothetical protein
VNGVAVGILSFISGVIIDGKKACIELITSGNLSNGKFSKKELSPDLNLMTNY